MLRRRISRNIRRSSLSRDRCNVDNASPAALDHFRQRRMRAAKRAANIRVDVTLPHGLVTLDEQRTLSNARIVYQNVRPAAESLARLRECREDTFRVRHI